MQWAARMGPPLRLGFEGVRDGQGHLDSEQEAEVLHLQGVDQHLIGPGLVSDIGDEVFRRAEQIPLR